MSWSHHQRELHYTGINHKGDRSPLLPAWLHGGRVAVGIVPADMEVGFVATLWEAHELPGLKTAQEVLRIEHSRYVYMRFTSIFLN